MYFPFTFTLNVPGLHNPFLATPGLSKSRKEGMLSQTSISSLVSSGHRSRIPLPPPPPRFPPANSLSPPLPLARKRGWVPSTPEPSYAATSAASTAGYLDTPAKYRDMPEREPEREVEEMIAELPPAKRRRTLAGSIVSTALSAALIGTAVGLTVYRLWRDRGKYPEQLPPPPPYQRGDWVPGVPEPPKQIEVTPPTPKARKPRSTPSSRRTVARHQRKHRVRLQPITPPRSVSPAYTSPQSDLDYIHVNEDHQVNQVNYHYQVEDVELEPESDVDEMDWIGDRVTQLIAEGQKALGREIVVMSDAKEDEVDDGSEGWEEEDDGSTAPRSSISRRGSVRSLRRPHRPRDLQLSSSRSSLPYPMSPPSSASPKKRRFDTESLQHSPARSTYGSSHNLPAQTSPRRIGRGGSVESDVFTSIASSFKEEEAAWESPELRESMEQARAKYLQRWSQ